MKGTKTMDEKINNESLEMEATEESTEKALALEEAEAEDMKASENEDSSPDEDDFSQVIKDDGIDDMEELKKQFPELSEISSPSELQGAEKYMRFRELGLSPTEAYLATGGGRIKERTRPNSPVSVRRRDDGIPERQLRMARELFSEMSDTEIQALYRRVTK